MTVANLLDRLFNRNKTGEVCPVKGELFTNVHRHGVNGAIIFPAPHYPRPISPTYRGQKDDS